MNKEKRIFLINTILILLAVIFTILVKVVDVRSVGVNQTNIGFATWNLWFHQLTGVHMIIYNITDWLGLVPIFVCVMFGIIGLIQLIQRRSFWKVDYDIIILGIYYVMVIAAFILFEMIPINYRPILIEGIMEASYPSSTTLLVLCVMPTLVFQANRRLKNEAGKKMITISTTLFSVFMVLGRLIAGVHWFTDIVGGILLSGGLFYIYKAVVSIGRKEEE